MAELSDSQKLLTPVVHAQLASFDKTMALLGTSDDDDDGEFQAMVRQRKAQIKTQIQLQRDAMISQQVVTIIVALANLAYEGNFLQARTQLCQACLYNTQARRVMQKYFPPSSYSMNAMEEAAVRKSLVFMQEFLKCQHVDTQGRISRQAYHQAVQKNIVENQHQPEMQQFLLMGLTTQDFIEAFTTNPDVPQWLSYLDALEQQSLGSIAIGNRVATVAIAVGRDMANDSDGDGSEAWDEKDWSPNSKNVQALGKLSMAIKSN